MAHCLRAKLQDASLLGCTLLLRQAIGCQPNTLTPRCCLGTAIPSIADPNKRGTAAWPCSSWPFQHSDPPLTPDWLLGAAQTLNEEAGIAATLQHLRGLHPPPHEIIVVDAASEDRWVLGSSSVACCRAGCSSCACHWTAAVAQGCTCLAKAIHLRAACVSLLQDSCHCRAACGPGHHGWQGQGSSDERRLACGHRQVLLDRSCS